MTSTIYSAMVMVAAVRFGRRKRREDARPATYLPPVSVLKPLHGTEPGLEESLRQFFVQEYPEYEVLFCARHESDAGLQLARRGGGGVPGGAGAVSDVWGAAVSECKDVVAGGAGGRRRDTRRW